MQLGEDVGDVVAYGLGTEGELPGDGGAGVALGYEVQYLTLTVGEGREGLGWSKYDARKMLKIFSAKLVTRRT